MLKAPDGDEDDATEVAEPDDPESAPAIPAAAVAGHAAALRRADALATDREIWRLAWPVILSQVLASAVSLIDIAMLGRLGPSALAAVGYVTQIFLLTGGVVAIGVAGVALISRDRRRRSRQSAHRARELSRHLDRGRRRARRQRAQRAAFPARVAQRQSPM
jgi:hypothetical protein